MNHSTNQMRAIFGDKERTSGVFLGVKIRIVSVTLLLAFGFVTSPAPAQVAADRVLASANQLPDRERTARPGTRAPHAWIGEDRSTLDLFGTGFVLLRFGRNPVDTTSLEKVAAKRKVPFRVVDIDDLKIAELYERKLVLVRPDGHVAWRDDVCPDDPVALIDRVRGAEAGQVHVQRNTA